MSKGKKILKILNNHRPFLAVFSVFLSLLLVVGSTYSWITYSDEKINQSKPNVKKLSAVIDEKFIPNLQWMAGVTTEKKLSVINNGQIPTFVRVSLYEFFASFEMDMNDTEGNSSQKISKSSSGSDIKMEDVSTWAKGSTYKLDSKTYYTVSEVYKSDRTNSNTAYIYKKNRTIDGIKYVTINFNDVAIFDENNMPPNGTKNYWYFSEGYFYYSEMLEPKEQTTLLLESVSLDSTIPNKYKGSFYQLIPVMDAHDRTGSLIEDWNLNSNSYVKEMYREKIH